MAKIGGARGKLLAEIEARNQKLRKAHELQYTKEIFKKFDSDKSGSIDGDEFQQLCEALGYVFASKSEVNKAVSMLDEDGTGDINWDEFSTWWQSEDKFSDFSHLLDDSAFYHDDSVIEGEQQTEENEEESPDWPSCTLHPFGLFRTIWDTLSAVAIVYSALFVPYRLAFEIEISGAEFVFDRIVDVSFIIDMVFSFFTAYYDPKAEQMVSARGKIASNYLKGWFLPDFLASVPMDSVAKLFMDDSENSAKRSEELRLLKLIRLLRLLKILRMVKMSRLLTKFQENMQIKSGIMISIKFALLSGVCAHYLACGWYVVSSGETQPWELCKMESNFEQALSLPNSPLSGWCTSEGCPSIDGCNSLPGLTVNATDGTLTVSLEDTCDSCISWVMYKPFTNWVYRYFIGIHGGKEWIVGDLDQFPWGHTSTGDACEAGDVEDDGTLCVAKYPLGHVKKSAIYTAAFYWSITTMTTLGFGEINGSDTNERYYVMMSIAIGCVIFAYGITNMCTLVANLNTQSVFAQTRADELIEWMTKKRVPAAMKKKVLQYFTHKTDFSPVYYHGKDDLLGELSGKLLTAVTEQTLIPVLQFSVVFDDNTDPALLQSLAKKLQAEVYAPAEYLAEVDVVMRGCFLIAGGSASLLAAGDSSVLEQLTQGSSYGEHSLLEDCRCKENLQATAYLDVYLLSRSAFVETCKKNRIDFKSWPCWTNLKYQGSEILPEPTLAQGAGQGAVPGVSASEVELRALRQTSDEQEDMIAQLLINLDNLNKFGSTEATATE